MRDVIKQFSVVVVAGLLAIPAANWAVHGLESPDGLIGVPITLSASPISASIHLAIALIWFALLAYAVGKFTHRYTGALVFGLAMTLIARRGIDAGQLVRHLDTFNISPMKTYLLFTVESLALSIPSIAIIFALAKNTSTRYEDEQGRFDPLSIKGMVVGSFLGLISCWVMVPTDNKGQAVFGIMAGCALTATIIRLMWPVCNGSVLFIIPVIVAVVGSISSAFIMNSDIINKMTSDTIWPLARPMPIDFIGAGIAGIAIGIGLARSFGAEEVTDEMATINVDNPTDHQSDHSVKIRRAAENAETA